jgi:hypothetical protein
MYTSQMPSTTTPTLRQQISNVQISQKNVGGGVKFHFFPGFFWRFAPINMTQIFSALRDGKKTHLKMFFLRFAPVNVLQKFSDVSQLYK